MPRGSDEARELTRRVRTAEDYMARWRHIFGLSVIAIILLLGVAITATIGWRPIIGPRARPLTDRTFQRTPERLERGRYLVEAVTPCVGCHTPRDWSLPGAPNVQGKEASGYVWADEGLPWLVAANLTPDAETGAGDWTDDMFARAVREGIGHDGRTLFPIMPYQKFRTMSDEDLASVIVYMRSLPAVKNSLPQTEVPFPVSRFINAVPEPVTSAVPQPDLSTPVKRGEYLARMAVCADCHSPVNDRGEFLPGLDFAGGSVFTTPIGKVASSNLTPHPSGIPYYTDELFIEAMRTGQVRARKLHPQMPWFMFGKMTDKDLRAVLAYLRTLKPAAHSVDNSLPPTQCALCGQQHGAGERNKSAGS